jgi:hypothetical protein
MQCYQGMNGLNGDRFVTGTLTRPFSRPGQMNQMQQSDMMSEISHQHVVHS